MQWETLLRIKIFASSVHQRPRINYAKNNSEVICIVEHDPLTIIHDVEIYGFRQALVPTYIQNIFEYTLHTYSLTIYYIDLSYCYGSLLSIYIGRQASFFVSDSLVCQDIFILYSINTF